MQTTAQYRIFDAAPPDRALVPARHLAREGHWREAERAYRDLIARDPDLKPAWAECFQLLRREGHHEEALSLAGEAEARFGTDVFSLTLRGAALTELGRFREALEALQNAAGLAPDEGAVWHELGYAAWRTGQPSYALFALDRAFTLWPRSATLLIRGLVLREAGRYQAAEVAFTGARESAEFPEQRQEASLEIARTHRFAAFSGRPSVLSATRRWFAETGGAVLCHGPARPDEAETLDAFAELARREQWQFNVLVSASGDPVWDRLATLLAIPRRATALEPAFGIVPLVTARTPDSVDPAWRIASAAVSSSRIGLSFVLEQPGDAEPADITGCLTPFSPDPDDPFSAEEAVRHPASRLAGRRLRIL